MIVAMKKIFVLTLDSIREKTLKDLQNLGVMHLDLSGIPENYSSDNYSSRELLTKALHTIPEPEDRIEHSGAVSVEKALGIAEKALILAEEREELNNELNLLVKEKMAIESWGDFEPDDILELQSKGVDIRLYELTKEQIKEIHGSVKTFIVGKSKSIFHVVCIIMDYKDDPHFEEYALHERSLSVLNEEIEAVVSNLEKKEEQLLQLVSERPEIEGALAIFEDYIDFDYAAAAMNSEENISYISGYIPSRQADRVKKAAQRSGWGIMITEPSLEDSVPTLVENPGIIKAIKPVFQLLETVPGYREFDISLWFLIFFSIFWAMIVGDAGYGFVFLVLTIVARIFFRKAPFEIFLLLFITSFTTIAWGTVTGTWFGVEALSRNEYLSRMIIPQIASFVQDPAIETDKILMHICFLIGSIQISIAHLVTFVRYFPSLKAFGQIGWLSVLWGLYLMIRFLVLKYPLHPASVYMILGGFIAVLVFSQQEGKFFRGVAKGFSNIIMTVFDGISFFSDVVSYIRLFAVGLATVAVAKSFNDIAAGIGFSGPAIIAVSLILFFGHSLNMILCCMSLIVHGVRLNMLEFSGHLNMEWSGYPYKPFSKGLNSEEGV